MARVDGIIVKVGDVVSFKSDYEQAGKIKAINGNILTLIPLGDGGFGGDYISGHMTTTQHADRCWIE
jgi:hypothetical protein